MNFKKLTLQGVWVKVSDLQPENIKFIKKYFKNTDSSIPKNTFSYEYINLFQSDKQLFVIGYNKCPPELLISSKLLRKSFKNKLK